MRNKLDAVGLDAIVQDLNLAFEAIRAEMTDQWTKPITQEGERALAHLETFAAISVRIMRTTNTSKIRDAARLEEIKARIQGREVLE